jgi:hypothetical protein
MLRRVALVRAEVSEELHASLIRMTRIGELGNLAVTSNMVFLRSVRRLLVTANVPSSLILVTLMKGAPSSSETKILTWTTWRNIQEDVILHSHRRENLNSYTVRVLRSSPSTVYCRAKVNSFVGWIPCVKSEGYLDTVRC